MSHIPIKDISRTLRTIKDIVPDNEKKFHELALQSILFKGRADWYFCYLKSERIARAIAALSERGGIKDSTFALLVPAAAELPGTIVHFVAGEVDLEVLLADLFALLSYVRVSEAAGALSRQNSLILRQEYEQLIEKLLESAHLSPFVSTEELTVPPLPFGRLTPLSLGEEKHQKTPRNPPNDSAKNAERALQIMDFIRSKGRASIKEIAAVIAGCSEKTVQRQLAVLIVEGKVRKEGERRWSVYFPV